MALSLHALPFIQLKVIVFNVPALVLVTLCITICFIRTLTAAYGKAPLTFIHLLMLGDTLRQCLCGSVRGKPCCLRFLNTSFHCIQLLHQRHDGPNALLRECSMVTLVLQNHPLQQIKNTGLKGLNRAGNMMVINCYT